MKRIYYSSGSVLTDDAIASAVLEYAQELAKLEGSDTVTIPVVGTDGAITEAQLLLGPASQLTTVQEPNPEGELDDSYRSALVVLRGRIRALHPEPITEPITGATRAKLSPIDPYET